MYEEYVKYNYLISPINGKKYKNLKNNKKTIENFGFSSLHELDKQYPNFPHVCQESIDKNNLLIKSNALKSNKNSKEKYYKNPKKCLYCNSIISYEKKKDNNFCNSSCSGSYNNKRRYDTGWKLSEESKQKISKANKKLSNKGVANKFKGIKKANYSHVGFNNCKKCNKLFSFKKRYPSSEDKIYCSDICRIHTITSRSYQNGSRKNIKYFNKFTNEEVILESSWEKQIAEYLDIKNIKWNRPKAIQWIDNNKNRLYYPDFYLNDYDIYLDPKNPYCMTLDKIKMDIVSKSINIVYGDISIILKSIDDLKSS